MASESALLRVEGLKMHYPILRGVLRRPVGAAKAVDGISFRIERGETFGLVGESGCGKTTAGRVILQLYPPTAGSVVFDGMELTSMSPEAIRRLRPRMQMIFQDPFASLNPRMAVSELVAEPMVIHTRLSRQERSEKVRELLELVGLGPEFERRYPHQFSGGQRQRIGLARALALSPEFIVCDEPISALDVSVQAQVVNLLQDLQARLGLTYLFIAHDLSMVRHISARVAVMYLGKLMEMAPRAELYERPLHPYTQALLSAAPVPDPVIEANRQQLILQGEVPSPAAPPAGCVFHTRCPLAVDECRRIVPDFREVLPGHHVACHLV